MPTQEEINDVLMDLEMQLAAAFDAAQAAAGLGHSFNNQQDGSLNEPAFRQAIKAIEHAIESVPQSDY